MSRLIHTTTFRQSGVGLVELMVALVLGLFVTAGVTSMFVQNKGSYNQDERNARMQENARYALQLLARDLSMAGFWGGVVSSGADITDPGSGTLQITADCGVSGVRWAFNPTQAMQYVRSGDAPNTEFACIEAGTYKTGTSALSIKHVAGVSTTSPESGHVYVRTVGASGNLINSDGTATPTGLQDWQYVVNIYYIATDANGIPWLRSKYLTKNGTQPTIQDEGQLAEGIEQFHIQFGIDTDGDGIPNQYLSNPTDTQLQTAVSARIYVLVRSSDQDFSSPPNDKIYTLGDLAVNGGNAFNDRFYRRVYTTTVQLRNTQYQLILQGATT